MASAAVPSSGVTTGGGPGGIEGARCRSDGTAGPAPDTKGGGHLFATTFLCDPTIEFKYQAHKHLILCRERWRNSVQEPG